MQRPNTRIVVGHVYICTDGKIRQPYFIGRERGGFTAEFFCGNLMRTVDGQVLIKDGKLEVAIDSRSSAAMALSKFERLAKEDITLSGLYRLVEGLESRRPRPSAVRADGAKRRTVYLTDVEWEKVRRAPAGWLRKLIAESEVPGE